MAVEAKVENGNSNKLVKYYKDVKSEFKKITWAPKEEVFKTTGVVIGTVVAFTLLIWVYDSFFGFTVKNILDYLR